MKHLNPQGRRQRLILVLLVGMVLMQSALTVASAQNLGGTPQLNKAVQVQTAAQPEGAFLNFVDRVGNVIAPVGAALCVVVAIVSYVHGRRVARWAIAALALLLVSGLTRLIEFWITQGQSGIQ